MGLRQAAREKAMITKKSEFHTSALRRLSDSKPIHSRRSEIDILNAKIQTSESLSLDEDYSIGGDPYNSTGQHVVIKQKE